MRYVIYNHSENKYANWPGSKNSYTQCLQNAQIFTNYADAQKQCCGNESVRPY